MSGTFVSVSGSTITVSHDGQPNETLDVVSDGTEEIRRNGKKCTLADLKAGDSLNYSGKPIKTLSAQS